ncbi:N-acetylglucosamine-6-phosphate deacetylase [Thermohalobacter berrensis]|uniref:N-acetylglucosamine-6-phosphate deacetylase n=1 Tax=Thermohalobacter berrensis TaxID=99594 RepID=A0A419T4A8_9FIRM|nr:N-acetylglucosamine-6-phosphate deacetylase [Thermohalobacter berrensis]RKD32256.1 N-acetylglucosamine-6-phosphate deacetylase [Thermohalobacter berrensis]
MEQVNGLINGKIIMEDSIEENKVLIFKDKIIDIIDKEEINKYKNINLIDVNGKYISPGFIDIHIHGAGGSDTMDRSIEAIETIGKTIAKTGTTSFLPTTMTMDKGSIYKALDTIRESMNSNMQGAKVLGAHLEGPFINKKYKGAQNPKHVLKPDYNFVKDYLDVIKVITMAPEVDKEFQFIKKIKDYENIVLSIGHSNATYEEVMESVNKGITHAAHLFNAMRGMHHREPGVVGAVLKSSIKCELIVDKVHVHPAIFQLIVDIKGINNIVLITDSMRAGGMKEGIYELGGQKVIVNDNSARLEDGTLAGSILTLNTAIKNMLENTNLTLYEVVQLATLNPAKAIGIDNKKGSIKIGKDADITVFDEDFNVHLTIAEGKIVYEKSPRPPLN